MSEERRDISKQPQSSMDMYVAEILSGLAEQWKNDGDTYHGYQFADWLNAVAEEVAKL